MRQSRERLILVEHEPSERPKGTTCYSEPEIGRELSPSCLTLVGLWYRQGVGCL